MLSSRGRSSLAAFFVLAMRHSPSLPASRPMRTIQPRRVARLHSGAEQIKLAASLPRAEAAQRRREINVCAGSIT